jgi:hypothetical protein
MPQGNICLISWLTPAAVAKGESSLFLRQYFRRSGKKALPKLATRVNREFEIKTPRSGFFDQDPFVRNATPAVTILRRSTSREPSGARLMSLESGPSP